MGEQIVCLRKDGHIRRYVGPHAATVAAQRIALGWEPCTPADELVPGPEPLRSHMPDPTPPQDDAALQDGEAPAGEDAAPIDPAPRAASQRTRRRGDAA
jgi:hypothetical protein